MLTRNVSWSTLSQRMTGRRESGMLKRSLGTHPGCQDCQEDRGRPWGRSHIWPPCSESGPCPCHLSPAASCSRECTLTNKRRVLGHVISINQWEASHVIDIDQWEASIYLVPPLSGTVPLSHWTHWTLSSIPPLVSLSSLTWPSWQGPHPSGAHFMHLLPSKMKCHVSKIVREV